MTEVSGATQYTDQEADNLLIAVFQFILIQMEFVSRIVNWVPQAIQTIQDALGLI